MTYTVSLLENFCFTFSSDQALIKLDGATYQWRPVNPRFTNFVVDIIQKPPTQHMKSVIAMISVSSQGLFTVGLSLFMTVS